MPSFERRPAAPGSCACRTSADELGLNSTAASSASLCTSSAKNAYSGLIMAMRQHIAAVRGAESRRAAGGTIVAAPKLPPCQEQQRGHPALHQARTLMHHSPTSRMMRFTVSQLHCAEGMKVVQRAVGRATRSEHAGSSPARRTPGPVSNGLSPLLLGSPLPPCRRLLVSPVLQPARQLGAPLLEVLAARQVSAPPRLLHQLPPHACGRAQPRRGKRAGIAEFYSGLRFGSQFNVWWV